MKELFEERVKEYFGEDASRFMELLKQPCTQGFFLNTRKMDKHRILDLIDFPYRKNAYSSDSFYHNEENIGKTKAYELGLIYPQEIAASLTTENIDAENVSLIVDLCAAPGGKTVNILNRLPDDVLCISNDMNHSRCLALAQNLERLGLDNTIITNMKCDQLAELLEEAADIVILDAPCSGEGMIRKYPEILETYSLENIRKLSALQKELLEDAYRILKKGGRLVYSTCTYAFEEDEGQITDFLSAHPDMSLLPMKQRGSSRLEGTVKLSPLDGTEGQFCCLMKKDGKQDVKHIKELKTVQNRLVEDFIRDNLDLDEYCLYSLHDQFYLSLSSMPDLKKNVIRYGICLGEIKGKRFEPNHSLYRANSLKEKYRYSHELNDEEYERFVSGQEIFSKLDNHYYLLTYRGASIGFGKCSNGVIKNKYPKGLRRMI
ncbi:MAG: RsmF rRNA methyltransferase first C-terminal domain-containing protein [Erysipelotrichaceae bacterium]|nr:RsmF rRNA methyltransferase first C-terminal domain-containing protein [Erysipelotrichaceae bacterium]